MRALTDLLLKHPDAKQLLDVKDTHGWAKLISPATSPNAARTLHSLIEWRRMM